MFKWFLIVSLLLCLSSQVKIEENVQGTKGDKIVSLVKSKLGKPYEWGGSGPDSFDCSGLAYWAHLQVGIELPRVSYDMVNVGKVIAKDKMKPGDLVFFDTGWEVGHVGVYVGNGQMIHAPQEGDGVTYRESTSGYYADTFYGARRNW